MISKAPATEAKQTPNDSAILSQSKHAFCSGFGQFHTNEPTAKNRQPYKTITFEQIQSMVDTPPCIAKPQAQWLIPSSLKSRTFKEQERDGKYWVLWLDFDENPPPLSVVKEHLIDIIGVADFEIYNTSSASEGTQKSRVLIPLSRWLKFDNWTLCQHILNDKFEALGITPDRSNERPAQLCYLPNKGEFYSSISQRNGDFLTPLEIFKTEIAQKELAIARAEQEINARRERAEKHKATLRYAGQEPSKLIDAFNQSYTIEDILLQAGYDQKGDKFRHPNSSSGRYTASVKNGRVHSLSSDDPLYSAGNGAHDAFSAFTVLFHGGA